MGCTYAYTSRLACALRVAMLAGGLILAGLPGISRAQGTDITIEFWHSYPENGVAHQILLTELIPLFEEAHPGVQVEPVAFPDANFLKVLLGALARGDGPAVARVDVRWITTLADLGLLEPLDARFDDFGPLAEAVYPGVLAAVTYRSHTYGLPSDASTTVLAWNKGMLGIAGIAQPAFTLAELLTQCAAIRELSDEDYLFAGAGTGADAILPWIWSLGGDFLTLDLSTATGYLNSPGTVAAYTHLVELNQASCFAPSLLDANIDPVASFLDGTTAAILAGPDIAVAVEAQSLYIALQLAPMLTESGEPEKSITLADGSAFVQIASSAFRADRVPTAEQTAAALEFIRFSQSDTYQLALIPANLIPAKPDLAAHDLIQQHPYFGRYMKQLATARSRPTHPAWHRIDAVLADAGRDILAAENSDDQPQTILDAAAARIDLILAEYE